ncbi:MAG: Ig-like domain-containing protein [Clostridia bacterium]|nr:Ig-like domain-containing protein [Clostridia bacterium]
MKGKRFLALLTASLLLAAFLPMTALAADVVMKNGTLLNYANTSELISNGGFDSGFDNWLSGTGEMLLEENFELTEDRSGVATSSSLHPLKNHRAALAGSIKRSVALEEGKKYYYSFYIKNTKTTGHTASPYSSLRTSISGKDAQGALLTSQQLIAGEFTTDGEWLLNEAIFDTTGIAEPQLDIAFSLLKSGEFMFDDFSLREVTTVSTSVTVNFVLPSGTPITAPLDEGFTVLGYGEPIENLAAGGSFVYDAPDSFSAGGIVYYRDAAFDETAATITALSETAANNVITATYAPLDISSIKPVASRVLIEGSDLALPKTVGVVFANGSEAETAVEWTNLSEAVLGTNILTGAVAGTTLTAQMELELLSCDAFSSEVWQQARQGADANHMLQASYSGHVVVEFDLEYTTAGDVAVMYSSTSATPMDSTPFDQPIMMRSDENVIYTYSGGTIYRDRAFSYETGVKYRVQIDFHTTNQTYSIRIINTATGASSLITPDEGCAFNNNADFINRISVCCPLGSGKAAVSNHAVSWIDGYATKKYVTTIGAQEHSSVYEKVAPGTVSVDTPAETIVDGGVTYYYDAATSVNIGQEVTVAAGETAEFVAAYIFMDYIDVTIQYLNELDVEIRTSYTTQVLRGEDFVVDAALVPSIITYQEVRYDVLDYQSEYSDVADDLLIEIRYEVSRVERANVSKGDTLRGDGSSQPYADYLNRIMVDGREWSSSGGMYGVLTIELTAIDETLDYKDAKLYLMAGADSNLTTASTINAYVIDLEDDWERGFVVDVSVPEYDAYMTAQISQDGYTVLDITRALNMNKGKSQVDLLLTTPDTSATYPDGGYVVFYSENTANAPYVEYKTQQHVTEYATLTVNIVDDIGGQLSTTGAQMEIGRAYTYAYEDTITVDGVTYTFNELRSDSVTIDYVEGDAQITLVYDRPFGYKTSCVIEDGTVKVTLDIGSLAQSEAVLLIAAYSAEGELCAFTSVPAQAGSFELQAPDAAAAKAFVWNKLSEMAPLN